jgi:hypothetical protein
VKTWRRQRALASIRQDEKVAAAACRQLWQELLQYQNARLSLQAQKPHGNIEYVCHKAAQCFKLELENFYKEILYDILIEQLTDGTLIENSILSPTSFRAFQNELIRKCEALPEQEAGI